MDAIQAGTLSEVGNIVLNSVMGGVSNSLKMDLTYSVPNYREDDFSALMQAHARSGATVILYIKARFSIKEFEIVGDIIIFLEVGSFDRLLEAVHKYAQAMETSS